MTVSVLYDSECVVCIVRVVHSISLGTLAQFK